MPRVPSGATCRGVGAGFLSGFGSLGLVGGCGSKLQTLSKLWNTAEKFNTAVAFGQAVDNVANGNGSFGDVLTVAQAGLGPAISAYGKMKGWSGCFVAGTAMLIPLPPEWPRVFGHISTGQANVSLLTPR